jgi:hypothetical protein
MNTQGFILFIFSICAAGILILIYPKYLHRYFQKYLIVLILGAITLAYVFFGRFLPIFIELIDPKNAPDPKIQTRVSNMLSLDMCPFMALCFPLLMILDKKRKYLIIMAPFAFFGGAISIFGASFSDFEHGLNPASIT